MSSCGMLCGEWGILKLLLLWVLGNPVCIENVVQIKYSDITEWFVLEDTYNLEDCQKYHLTEYFVFLRKSKWLANGLDNFDDKCFSRFCKYSRMSPSE